MLSQSLSLVETSPNDSFLLIHAVSDIVTFWYFAFPPENCGAVPAKEMRGAFTIVDGFATLLFCCCCNNREGGGTEFDNGGRPPGGSLEFEAALVVSITSKVLVTLGGTPSPTPQLWVVGVAATSLGTGMGGD